MPFRTRNEDLGLEIPVTTTPIFEGQLLFRTEKKNWQWRLFRFDGTNFTCLSNRKIKSTSTTTTVESLLLATPKEKHQRLIDGKNLIKYYQLPEWTIDVFNISCISVLKKKVEKNTFSKCFSIRTFSNQCFILKAQKQKDLERWLFVLIKMWKFTLTVKEQQQAQTQVQQQQQQQEQEEEDDIPLAHSIKQHCSLSNEKIHVIEEWRKSLAELMANDACIKKLSCSPPPIEPIPDDDTMSVFTDITSVSNKRPPPIVNKKTLRKKRSDHVGNWMNNNKEKKLIAVEVVQQQEVVQQGKVLHRQQGVHYISKISPVKITSSMPLTDDDLSIQQQQQQSLSFSTTNKQEEEEEEDISLADLQKSLKKVGLNHCKLPFDSSIPDFLQQQQQQKRYFYYQPSMIVAAPAAPAAPAIPQYPPCSYLFDFNTYYDQKNMSSTHHYLPYH